MIPAIPLVGGLLGALASSPLGTTVARGILGGLITGAVADVVMKRQRATPQGVASPAPVAPMPGAMLPDGQPVNPPATPGDLASRQMVEQYIDKQDPCAAMNWPGSPYTYVVDPATGNCVKSSVLAWREANPGVNPAFAPIA